MNFSPKFTYLEKLKTFKRLVLICFFSAFPLSSFTTATPLKADLADDLYTIAQLSYNEASKKNKPAEYKLAAEKFAKYLEKFPEHPNSASGCIYLASCLSKLGKNEEALQAYLEVLKRSPTGPQAGAAALQLGLAQYETKDYARAIQYLTIANKELPQSSSSVFGVYVKALSHQKLEKYDKARDDFLFVLNQEEGKKYHSRSKFHLGETYFKTGEFNKSYQFFQGCTEDSDMEIKALSTYKCAIIAQKLGDTDKATDYFKKVLKMGDLKEWHSSSALILMVNAEKKKDWKVISQYERYGDIGLSGPQTLKRLELLAKSYQAQDDTKKAQSYYSKLARLSEGTSTGFEVAYYQITSKARKKVSINETNHFLKTYQKQFSSDERYESVKLLKAEILYENSNYEEALKVYNSLDTDKIAPENIPTIGYRICKIAVLLKEKDSAISYINQYARKYPEDSRTTYLLYDKATILAELTHTDEAIRGFEEVINHKNAPEDILRSSWQYIAKLNLEQKNYQKAVGAYESLNLKFSTGTPSKQKAEWYFWLAYSQYKLEKFVEAKQNFLTVRALSRSFQPEETAELLALIAYNEKDSVALRKEVINYEKLGGSSLPEPIYLILALEDSKNENWGEAWNYFNKYISLEKLYEIEAYTPPILENYAQVAFMTENWTELKVITNFLKPKDLGAYRKALNLFRSGTATYYLNGAEDAKKEVEEALLINPEGRLRHELLLLHGKIEMETGEKENGTRVLKRVYQFGGKDTHDLKVNALNYLIKSLKPDKTSNTQPLIKEYQKELEQLR